MKKILIIVPYFIFAIFIGATVLSAGSLVPPGPVANTMYTLTDIFNLSTGDTTATLGSGIIPTTPGVVVGTGKTLTEVYTAISNEITAIDPSKILTGTTFFGKDGTALSNMFDGTGAGFPGGSQAEGGVDDYNTGGDPATGRYSTTWTACNAGNNYCGTGEIGADAKDEATGLIWSMPCHGQGCSSFSEVYPPTQYSWATTTPVDPGKDINPNNLTDLLDPDSGLTASELCSTVHPGWSLPHFKQLLQAYIDGSYGNLEPLGINPDDGTGFIYHSATTSSIDPTADWLVSLSDFYPRFDTKDTGVSNIRCVRTIP